MTDKDLMLMAIKKAAQGIKKGQTPFGACIARNGRMVSCSHNIVWKSTDITAHAEIAAIRQACRKLKTIDLSGCVIYSTCEPCPMCFSACHWAGISHIFFGSSIADAAKCGFNELAIPDMRLKKLGRSHLKITGGFMRSESLELFEAWMRIPGRRVY